MKKFKFRLQTLLSLKQAQTTKAATIYAQELKKFEWLQNSYQQVGKEKELLLENMLKKRKHNLSNIEQTQYVNLLNGYVEELKNLHKKMLKAQKKIEESRAFYSECKEKENILINLKEKQYIFYKKEIQKHEDRALEAIIYARNRSFIQYNNKK